MEIKINNKVLDVTLEKENTAGDIFSSLEQWLSDSGHRMAEIKIDGEVVGASALEEVFTREIKSIKSIEIQTSIIAELAAASLLNLLEDIKEYESLDFKEKSKYFEKWKKSATAAFISDEMPDRFAFCESSFSKGDMAVHTLYSITEEIQREVTEPADEIKKLEPVLNEICERLVDLPLDIQTGKDAKAAQTIQLFSAVTEKIFRLFRQLGIQGYISNETDKKNLLQLIEDFGNVLKELLDAYERSDSVLMGDISEYEASPKLKEVYKAILENINKNLPESKKSEG